MKKIDMEYWILNFFKECDLKRLIEIKKNYEIELKILNKVIEEKSNENTEQ